MVVANQTDSMYAGNARIQQYTITDEDQAGSPAKDLTGLTFEWTLALLSSTGQPITEDPLITKTSANGITVIGSPINGELQVELDKADTDAITPGTYYFELESFDGFGGDVVLATGTLEILPNVEPGS